MKRATVMRIRILLLSSAILVMGCGRDDAPLPATSPPGTPQSTPRPGVSGIDNEARAFAAAAQRSSTAPSADSREERPVPQTVLTAIHTFIAHKVAEGFDDEPRIIEQAIGLFVNGESNDPFSTFQPEEWESQFTEDELKPHFERIVANVLEERGREEARWESATDCDRLDEAFDGLNNQGIIARQNLPCCLTCALAEISVIMEEERQRGHAVIGYALYHEQDTAHVPDGQLYLAFGAEKDDRDEMTAIGKKIVEELNAVGLQANWSGDSKDRISVTLEWKKRRFSSRPVRRDK